MRRRLLIFRGFDIFTPKSARAKMEVETQSGRARNDRSDSSTGLVSPPVSAWGSPARFFYNPDLCLDSCERFHSPPRFTLIKNASIAISPIQLFFPMFCVFRLVMGTPGVEAINPQNPFKWDSKRYLTGDIVGQQKTPYPIWSLNLTPCDFLSVRASFRASISPANCHSG